MTVNHNMAEQPEFIKKQYEFASHIRNPDKNPCPSDVEARRMNIYRELFYNNVEGFMSNSFPVLHEIMGEQRWHAMIRDYFDRHLSHTPLFPEMPREFLKYLESEREPQQGDPHFMLELAHYEWVELALSVSDLQIDMGQLDPSGDLLEGRPVLSPLAWPLSYQYDVQHISNDYQPQQPAEQPVYLVVYRDQDDQLNFLDINPVTARLLQFINEDNTLTGREMLSRIAEELNHPNPDVVIQGGLQILHDLLTRGVILGTSKQ